ncbi:hypothetical protein VNO78_10233 [Psophocarpus tetragonolobus]|uniref:Uncharacterized protein n=1 Tax=Psophocarpus tetragonolobus TaxID=3891 RepID=A0AAN9SR38_PSOTE
MVRLMVSLSGRQRKMLVSSRMIQGLKGPFHDLAQLAIREVQLAHDGIMGMHKKQNDPSAHIHAAVESSRNVSDEVGCLVPVEPKISHNEVPDRLASKGEEKMNDVVFEQLVELHREGNLGFDIVSSSNAEVTFAGSGLILAKSLVGVFGHPPSAHSVRTSVPGQRILSSGLDTRSSMVGGHVKLNVDWNFQEMEFGMKRRDSKGQFPQSLGVGWHDVQVTQEEVVATPIVGNPHVDLRRR